MYCFECMGTLTGVQGPRGEGMYRCYNCGKVYVYERKTSKWITFVALDSYDREDDL